VIPSLNEERTTGICINKIRKVFEKYGVDGDILDVGCGLGYGSKMLYDNHKSVIAFDISRDAISYAKRSIKNQYT